MSGFVALAWPAEAPRTAAESLSTWLDLDGAFRRRLTTAGLRLWTWGRWPLPVTSVGPATVVGPIHVQHHSELTERLGTAEAARRLLRSAWGSYVALLPGGGDQDAPAVLRDPSGAQAAFVWRRAGLWVIASEIDRLPPKLWPERIALDWDAVVETLAQPLSALARTPLRGVTAPPPGGLARLGAEAAVERLWRPCHFISDAPAPEAEAALAQTVSQVTRQMTSGARRLLVEVSGGLDSAIVAGCWAKSASRCAAVALNYFGDRAEGDERAYACAVCRRAGLRLLTRPKALRPLELSDLAAFAGGVRPSFAALDADRDRDTAALALRFRVDAILTGGGGDAVFVQAPTALTAADWIATKGVGAAFDPFVRDLARQLRRSIWSVLLEARRPFRAAPRLALTRFLRPEARLGSGRAPHPWLADLDEAPPAKRLQIEALVAAQEGFAPSRRALAAPVLQPLLAQPVLELCLRIPTWAHLAGGVDRGLARRAFASELPEAVARRRSKGSLTSLYARQAAASLAVLRPLLLDGVLADAGVLDRTAVDAALTPERLMQRADGAVLVRAASVEAWVRHWQGRIPDAPKP